VRRTELQADVVERQRAADSLRHENQVLEEKIHAMETQAQRESYARTLRDKARIADERAAVRLPPSG
jgi:hypothetical protein